MPSHTLSTLPFTQLLGALSAPEPTPGGGSGSAMAGAVGAALLVMVASLPKPRAATPDEEQELARAGQRAGTARDRLAELIDRDADAYQQVVDAYRLPKTTDHEKSRRTDRIQTALAAAIETPLEMMEACTSALRDSATIARFGNASAASDVGVAIELLSSALRGARLNVTINLGSLKSPDAVEGFRSRSEELEREASEASDVTRRLLSDRS